MDPYKRLRLLVVAAVCEKNADSRISFDGFIQDVVKSHDDMSDTIKAAEDMHALMNRSGYPELAGRMNEVISGMREMSDIVDTLRRMYSSGKLRYNP